jgi:hypothetical protein
LSLYLWNTCTLYTFFPVLLMTRTNAVRLVEADTGAVAMSSTASTTSARALVALIDIERG